MEENAEEEVKEKAGVELDEKADEEVNISVSANSSDTQSGQRRVESGLEEGQFVELPSPKITPAIWSKQVIPPLNQMITPSRNLPERSKDSTFSIKHEWFAS